MINKKIIITGIVLFTTHLVLSSAILAQTMDKLEIIDEDSVVLSCIEGSEFDAMNEQQQDKVELPICEENITTEELAAELNGESTLPELEVNGEKCVHTVDYDAMTDDERGAIEIPVCEELELRIEELATETYREITLNNQILNDEQCLTIVDYDVMTDGEKAANAFPICDEPYYQEIAEPLKE